MTKSVKRHVKRPKKYGRETAAPGVHGRPSTGLGQAKSRSSFADSKCARVVGLMIVPAVFGIFGILMFPPSFDFSQNDAPNASAINGSINNETLSDQILLNNTNQTISGGINESADNLTVVNNATDAQNQTQRQRAKRKKSDAASSKEGKDGKQVKQKKQSQQSPKKSKEQQNSPLPRIKNFKPTILDSLKIRDVVVDGRTVRPTELTKDHPASPVKAYMYEGFLSDKECAGLMRVHQHHIADAEVNDPILCFDSISTLRKHLKNTGQDIKVSRNDFTEGTMCINASFSTQLKSFLTWSYSTAFYPGESKFSTKFEDRVYQATGLKPSNGGKFQITSYPEGIGYKTHTDCVLDDPEKRDRFGTILVYLQDVEEGGETKFPELGISVKPRKGRAIVWNNMNSSGDCEPVSVHEAAQVMSGHKYIIQRWYYYENFYQLGKRSQEPPLPPREPGQPRVNCDEYEHGSCRWYDEWNYEHLLDYRAVQRDLL